MRIHQKRLWPLFVTLLLATSVALSGCPKDPYRVAIQGSSDVSQAVSSAIKITASYYSTGKLNDGQKAQAATYFIVVTNCNMTFRKAVVDVHNAGLTGVSAFLPVADGFVNCVRTQAPLSSDKEVANILQAVDTAIHGVEVAVSSAKGGSK